MEHGGRNDHQLSGDPAAAVSGEGKEAAAVVGGRYAELAAEMVTQDDGGVEADPGGDLLDGEIGLLEQAAGAEDALLCAHD